MRRKFFTLVTSAIVSGVLVAAISITAFATIQSTAPTGGVVCLAKPDLAWSAECLGRTQPKPEIIFSTITESRNGADNEVGMAETMILRDADSEGKFALSWSRSGDVFASITSVCSDPDDPGGVSLIAEKSGQGPVPPETNNFWADTETDARLAVIVTIGPRLLRCENVILRQGTVAEGGPMAVHDIVAPRDESNLGCTGADTDARHTAELIGCGPMLAETTVMRKCDQIESADSEGKVAAILGSGPMLAERGSVGPRPLLEETNVIRTADGEGKFASIIVSGQMLAERVSLGPRDIIDMI